jgi:hypothetical protein
MRPKTTHELVEGSERPPRKGDRIELLLPRLGVPLRGTLFHVDELQILVKWDNGRSESLRPRSADRFRIIDDPYLP